MAEQTRTVRALDDDFIEWEFNGTTRRADDEVLVVHPDDLLGCKAIDLLDAMRKQHRAEMSSAEYIMVSAGPRDDDLSNWAVTPVQFEYGTNNDLVVRLRHLTEHWEDDEQALRQRVDSVLAPLMKRHGFRIVEVAYDPYYSTVVPYHLDIELAVRLRGQDLHTLHAAGEDACALLDAALEGNADRSSLADLLRAGHATALIGHFENDWLEAKSQHYDLTKTEGKVLLAMAVARFANSPDGGVIVIGLATKSRPHGDEIVKVTPMPRDPRTKRRYLQALQQHLYPPPVDLQIENVAYDNNTDIFLVDVPPQPEDLRPFLVSGALVGDKVRGAFIGIVSRHGDTTIPTTAAEIHTTLAAGRALLRRGILPPGG